MDSSEQRTEVQTSDLSPGLGQVRGASEIAVSLEPGADIPIVSQGFDPAAWDHWLLIAVMIAFSAWVLRTSFQWRREWKQYCQERASQALMR